MFGGNILHSFNIPMQLTIHEIENRTKVGVCILPCGADLSPTNASLDKLIFETSGKSSLGRKGSVRRMKLEGTS